MKVEQSFIPGVFWITHTHLEDSRGYFTKIYQGIRLSELSHEIRESYYSVSHLGVIRGMHFQIPPASMTKLVTRITGFAIDVVLDLRIGSPTYGKYDSREMWEKGVSAVFISEGIAHGFQSMAESTTLLYQCSAGYNPEFDRGVRYDSFGFEWPRYDSRLLSQRDESHPSLRDYVSPFKFQTR